ncbi:MAG: sialidase family protein [Kiritimatiellaeota bacterium]|nr:sialidase family protein [Kiritimatiellota bacterium]
MRVRLNRLFFLACMVWGIILAQALANSAQEEITCLLKERVDAQARLIADFQPVYDPQDSLAGWGTLAKAGANTLVTVFSAGREAEDDPCGSIRMVRSENNGIDWSGPMDVADTPLSDREPGVVALKSGGLLVTWRAVRGLESPETVKNEKPGDVQRWQAAIAKITAADAAHAGNWCVLSRDGGKTWGAKVGMPVHSVHGPIQLKDGRLLCLGLGTDNGKPILGAAESRDDGQTWILIWKKELNHPELAGIRYVHQAELPDGRIIGVFTTDPKDWKYKAGCSQGGCYVPNQIWQVESADGGKTWSTPCITPMCGFPPHLTVLKDGRIICTYGSARAYPGSQRACLSYDGGKTWDYLREIVLRGDAPDKHRGFPSSVEADDGSMVSLFSQTLVSQKRPGIERVRWEAPARPAAPQPDSRFAVDIGEAKVVVAGPPEERRWGFYQFPAGSRMTRSGKPIVFYSAADDVVGGGASYPVDPFISHDHGKTWVKVTPADLQDLPMGFRLKDGTELGFSGMKPMSAGQFGLAPVTNTSPWLYRYSDLPKDFQCFQMARRAPGGKAENYSAPLEFPGLALIRYRFGENSEVGRVELPDKLNGPCVWQFGVGGTCELPDKTILILGGARRFQKDGPALDGTYLMASQDGGRSWKFRSVVVGTEREKVLSGCEEANMVVRPNGTLVAVVRSEGGAQWRSFYMPDAWLTISRDNGMTWSAPKRFNNFGVLPRLITLDNGIVVCSYGRPGVEIRFSNDPDGLVWSDAYAIQPRIGMIGRAVVGNDTTCGYTALIPSGPDSFYIVYSDFCYRDADWILHKAIKVREVRVTVKTERDGSWIGKLFGRSAGRQ